MKVERLGYGHIEILRLRLEGDPADLPANLKPSVWARFMFPDGEITLLKIGEAALVVQGDGRNQAERLEDLRVHAFQRIVWILDVDPPLLTVQVHTFQLSRAMPPTIIGIDPEAFRIPGRSGPARPEHILEWFRDQFLLTGDGGRRLAFLSTQEDGFTLHGEKFRAAVRRQGELGPHPLWMVAKVTRRNPQGSESIALCEGDLEFTEGSPEDAHVSAEAAAELAALVASGSSFLDIWGRYSSMEEEEVLERARRIGSLTYDTVQALPGSDGRMRHEFHLTSEPDTIDAFKKALKDEGGFELEVAAALPDALGGEDPGPRNLTASRSATFLGKMEVVLRSGQLTLTPRGEEEPTLPEAGVIHPSIRASSKAANRRKNALTAIMNGACAMPQLRLLLENLPCPVRHRITIPAMTPSVQRKVFGDDLPTPDQLRAIKVALNTPDIALIQGPPGTGKTKIIVALAERLLEVWDPAEGIQGKLLLSGYQHDAVHNAIQKMNGNGLPPIKFGGRPGEGEDEDHIHEKVRFWSKERVQAIGARHPMNAQSTLKTELAAEAEAYFLAPGNMAQTAALLARVAEHGRNALSGSLLARFQELSAGLSERAQSARRPDPEREGMIRLVRSLRTTPAAFADDGRRNADLCADALLRFGRLEPEAEALLARASSWRRPEPPPFLAELRMFRRARLLTLIRLDHTSDTVARYRQDVAALLKEALEELDRRHQSGRDGVEAAVLAYLDALENDPQSVREALVAYTSVFAATCQQSDRESMGEVKKGEAYDTVVVDEAARANPLDLFIPMAKGRRRIILVGDHRQLPHILDEKLGRELELGLTGMGSSAERTRELLAMSLFERLFLELRAREDKDGFPRTVTLGDQFRMHRTLGNFVSEQFYKVHGEHEAFRSPRPDQDFAHGLPGYVGPAVWLDVPPALGREGTVKDSHSKIRKAEAEVIANDLKRLMDDPAGASLTFGVISFYAQQVVLLRKELEKLGMLHVDEDGTDVITPPYQELRLPNGRIQVRLRYGTVDAFQGMEFDVVYLSMVRSSPSAREDTEKSRRNRFGHLMSANRLCVAMSRQKRLLVVAGDASMLEGPAAAAAIGPLVAFHGISQVVPCS